MPCTDPAGTTNRPGHDAIAAALAHVPFTGTGPALLTLLDTLSAPGGVLAEPETTEPELWHTHGIPMVLHAIAEGLRRHPGTSDGVAGYAFAGLTAMVHAASEPGTRTRPPRRALLVGGDPALRADLTTLAPGLLTAETAADAVTTWRAASLVVVCADTLDACQHTGLPPRPFLVVPRA